MRNRGFAFAAIIAAASLSTAASEPGAVRTPYGSSGENNEAGYLSPNLPSCDSTVATKMLENYLSQRNEHLQNLRLEPLGMDAEAVLEAIGYHIKKVRCKGHMTLTNGKDYAVSYLFWLDKDNRVRALLRCDGCRQPAAPAVQ